MSDLVVTSDMVAADEEFMDGDYVDESAASPKKAAGAGLGDLVDKDDAEMRAGLEKVLSVAQKMSDFYSSSASFTEEEGSRKLPKGFLGSLYEYQKKVWPPLSLPCCPLAACRN